MRSDSHNRPADGRSAGARMAANSLYGILSRVFDFVLRFVVLAWIARYLGVFSYGDFALVTAAAAFVRVLADCGMEPIVQREIATRPQEAGAILSATLALPAIVSAALLVVMACAGPAFGVPPPLRAVLLIESAAQAMVVFQILLLGVIRAHEQTRLDLLTTLVYHAASLLLVGAAILLDLGFFWLFAARTLAELIKLGLMGMLVHRRFVPIRFRWDIRRSRHMLKEGLPILAVSFATVATARVNVFILSHFRDNQDVAFFDFPHRLVMAVGMVPLMVVFACFPTLCRKAAESRDAFSAVCGEVFKALLLLSLPAAAVFVAGGDWIIRVAAGAEFGPAGVSLQILGLALPPLFLMPLLNFTLTAAGRQHLNVVGVGVGLVVNVALSWFLVPDWGFVGAAAAMLVGHLAGLAATWLLVVRLAADLPPWRLAGRPLLAALPMIGVSVALARLGPWGLAAGLAAGGVLFAAALWVLGVLRRGDLAVARELLGRKGDRHGPPPPTAR